jgi:hypothetical protein
VHPDGYTHANHQENLVRTEGLSAVLDAAIDHLERARDLRDGGDDTGSFEIAGKALASIERLTSDDAALTRAQLAILLAEISTRTHPVEEAIELAEHAVDRARLVRRLEPVLEASALYMLGKAERPSRTHAYGAHSFAESLLLWRRLEGERSRYTLDAASSVAVAHLKSAHWQHALEALELLIEQTAEPPFLLHRAVVHERMGDLNEAAIDLASWRTRASSRPIEEQLRGELAESRLAATRGETRAASTALARAYELSTELPSDHARHAALLEGSAWIYAVATDPPWLLASEVLMRRAAAISWSPAIADTAARIAAAWRYGAEEELVQPAFAVLEIEACLQVWDEAATMYVERPGHQTLQLVVAGAPTSIERLADERWRDLCVQRLFSTFHAEQFKNHEANFVAPAHTRSLRLPPMHVLDLLPALRVPKWATGATVAVTSLGEVEVLSVAETALLATRALPSGEALVAMQRALPSLGKDIAREMLGAPREMKLSPVLSIPMFPTS